MDRKQYKIITILIGLFFITFVFSGCFIIKRNTKEFKKPLLKSIYIDSNNIVTIILDNSNQLKKIGEIHAMKLFYYASIIEYEKRENEIIIKRDISEYKEKFIEDKQYRIEIKWYGGHLFLETIFQNGQFTVLKEKYLDRI
ncbi:MAG: hypothetical protein IKR40_01175 [Treponema sp.]|nr:hypothetical protein [Treponema sp.]